MATNSSANSDQLVEDERRLKRKQSNKESARRSRKKKRDLLEELTAEMARLKGQKAQLIGAVDAATNNFLNMDGQNSVLRAQVSELSQRLESLNSISSRVCGSGTMMMNQTSGSFWNDPVNGNQWNNNPMYGNGGGQNQIQQVPIVASAAMHPF